MQRELDEAHGKAARLERNATRQAAENTRLAAELDNSNAAILETIRSAAPENALWAEMLSHSAARGDAEPACFTHTLCAALDLPATPHTPPHHATPPYHAEHPHHATHPYHPYHATRPNLATSAYHDIPAYRTSCPHRCAAAVRMQSEASEAAAAPARAAQAVAEAETLSLQADPQPPRMAQ